MRKTVLAIVIAASVPATTIALSTPVEAGGCRASGAFAGTAYGFGRYGRYDHGPCAGFGYGDPPAYYPPAYYEYEPAYDGYPTRTYNPNANYDFTYRRVEYREYYGPRRVYARPCCRPYW